MKLKQWRSYMAEGMKKLIGILGTNSSTIAENGSVDFAKSTEEFDMSKRYVIVNKNTQRTRRTVGTRAEARISKKDNERIFDTLSQKFVR